MDNFCTEERVKPTYHYKRVHETQYGVYVLDVVASTFGSIWIRDNEQAFFKKVFSTEGEGRKLQALHHARPNDIAASIQVTKCNMKPVSLEPLQFPPNANKTVQYMLLDEKGFMKVLDYLPYYHDKVIPWVASASAEEPVVKKPSPHSTMTTKRQIKCNQVLMTYPEATLDMGVVPFESGPSLELRYRTKEGQQPRAGVYLSKQLLIYLMDERSSLYETINELKEAGPWANIVTDFSIDEAEGVSRKRMKVEQDSQEPAEQDSQDLLDCSQ